MHHLRKKKKTLFAFLTKKKPEDNDFFFLSQCLYVLFTHAYYFLLSAIVDRRTTKTYLHRYPSFFFPSLFIFPSFLQMEHDFFFSFVVLMHIWWKVTVIGAL